MEYKSTDSAIPNAGNNSESYRGDDEDAEIPIKEYEKETVAITNNHGFHIRPITAFVKLAMKYNARIYVGNGKKSRGSVIIGDKPYVSIKSPLGLLGLCAEKGSNIEIIVEKRENSREIVKSLAELIKSGFGES